MRDKVSVRDIIKNVGLEVVYMPEDVDYYVYSHDLNRPGLQLAGYFEYFSYHRIQLIGKTEYNYFGKIDKDKRREVLDRLLSYDIPAIVVTRNLVVNNDMIELAKKHNKIILRTEKSTTRIMNKLSNYLDSKLSPHTTLHGVLVDVYGVGVLIKGESSIGKSETALELIQRGHRLIADDAVEIHLMDDDSTLIGEAPELLKHFMEIRGLGIIDIKSMYGVGAVKDNIMIDLIVNLENWSEKKYYDRLGLDKEYETILDRNVESITIPVKPGRNTAMIIEVAAMNFRQRCMGYDSAQEFTKKLSQITSRS